MFRSGTAEALDFVETVSKNELIINKKKQKFDESAVPKYIISPNGKFRVRWDLLSVTLICCMSCLGCAIAEWRANHECVLSFVFFDV